MYVCGALVGLGVLLAVVLGVWQLAHSRSTGLLVARLGLVFAIVVVCVLALLALLGLGRVHTRPKLFLWVTVVAGAVGNLAFPFAALRGGAWSTMLPLIHPAGADFRAGLYDPAMAFTTTNSAWPPLTLMFGRPFTLLSQSSGYIVQVVVLICLGLAAAALSANLAVRATVEQGPGGGTRVTGTKGLILLSMLWLVTSYGFLFELERGNVNVYALFFSALSLWWLLRFPKQMWVSVILLAIAINLKVYPALLLVVVFWRYRWRALLPVILSNAALLLVAGPANAWHFIVSNLRMESGSAMLWVGNHSALSYAWCLHDNLHWVPTWTKWLFLAIPLALWVLSAVILIRRGWSQKGAVLLAAASVTLMCIIPPVSHDYTLVLMALPLMVLASVLTGLAGARGTSRLRWSALMGLLGLTLVVLAGATLLWYDSNKYPLLVLVQLLFLGVMLLFPRAEAELGRRAPEEASPASQSGSRTRRLSRTAAPR